MVATPGAQGWRVGGPGWGEAPRSVLSWEAAHDHPGQCF